jgi:hypothetical protein
MNSSGGEGVRTLAGSAKKPLAGRLHAPAIWGADLHFEIYFADSAGLRNRFKSGQRLSLENRPTEGARNLDVLPRRPLFRQV